MPKIFENVSFGPDTGLGRISRDGEVYSFSQDLIGAVLGAESLVGQIDYDEGVVYLAEGDEEITLGWIDDDSNVVAQYEDEEVEIGYVKDSGELYYYLNEDEDATYVGVIEDMTDPVEGAAAMLLFFEFKTDTAEAEADDGRRRPRRRGRR